MAGAGECLEYCCSLRQHSVSKCCMLFSKRTAQITVNSISLPLNNDPPNKHTQLWATNINPIINADGGSISPVAKGNCWFNRPRSS